MVRGRSARSPLTSEFLDIFHVPHRDTFDSCLHFASQLVYFITFMSIRNFRHVKELEGAFLMWPLVFEKKNLARSCALMLSLFSLKRMS